jgi:8-oxo-dGTP pyrophosphatase MutT (NUDIX family)
MMDLRSVSHYSAADFRDRALRRAGPGAGDDVFGDHSLNPGSRAAIVREGLRPAAVLVPVVDRPDGATMLLTKRAQALKSHPGQVAFPGGRVDPGDSSVEAAAMREADEEIGLGRDHIEIVGRLADYYSGSGFRITPVLSVVRPGFSLTINADEVDEAFEVPLGFLMDAANHRTDSRIWNNIERYFYAMPYGGRHIWGVTAGIIRAVHDRLYA